MASRRFALDFHPAFPRALKWRSAHRALESPVVPALTRSNRTRPTFSLYPPPRPKNRMYRSGMLVAYASPVDAISKRIVPRSATWTEVPWKMGLGLRFPVIFTPARVWSISQHVIGGWWLTCSATISSSPTRVRCVSPNTLLMGFFIGGRTNALFVPPAVPSSALSDSMSR